MARVPSYEETHAEVQSILLPPALQKGVSVQLLHPLSKHLALTYRMLLESGKPSSAGNPFAAMMGGGGAQVRRGDAAVVYVCTLLTSCSRCAWGMLSARALSPSGLCSRLAGAPAAHARPSPTLHLISRLAPPG